MTVTSDKCDDYDVRGGWIMDSGLVSFNDSRFDSVQGYVLLCVMVCQWFVDFSFINITDITACYCLVCYFKE